MQHNKFNKYIILALLGLILSVFMGDYPCALGTTGGRPSDEQLWSQYARYKHTKIYNNGQTAVSIFGHC